MRQLKHHEKRLLRKVDLYSWKNEDNLHIAKIIRRYHIQNKDDYINYRKLCGMITKLSHTIQTTLPAENTFRIAMTEQLLTKLYNMGIISTTKSLQCADKINVSQICRRRLPVIMMKLKMAETLTVAITYIEQGQVRVGPNVVTDSAFLVVRAMEDYVTWVDTSKIKRTVLKYNNKLDDYDLL